MFSVREKLGGLCIAFKKVAVFLRSNINRTRYVIIVGDVLYCNRGSYHYSIILEK